MMITSPSCSRVSSDTHVSTAGQTVDSVLQSCTSARTFAHTLTAISHPHWLHPPELANNLRAPFENLTLSLPAKAAASPSPGYLRLRRPKCCCCPAAACCCCALVLAFAHGRRAVPHAQEPWMQAGRLQTGRCHCSHGLQPRARPVGHSPAHRPALAVPLQPQRMRAALWCSAEAHECGVQNDAAAPHRSPAQPGPIAVWHSCCRQAGRQACAYACMHGKVPISSGRLIQLLGQRDQ